MVSLPDGKWGGVLFDDHFVEQLGRGCVDDFKINRRLVSGISINWLWLSYPGRKPAGGLARLCAFNVELSFGIGKGKLLARSPAPKQHDGGVRQRFFLIQNFPGKIAPGKTGSIGKVKRR